MTEYHFIWQGINREGLIVKGDLKASAKGEVIFALNAQRIRTTHIHRKISLDRFFPFKSTLKSSAITRFTRQLATLLGAGIPLLQAFQILRKSETSDLLNRLICDVHEQIEAGLALNQALRRHAVFNGLFCNLVAAGETAGMLDTVLERLALHLEKTEKLKANIRSALIYPIAVLIIAAIIFSIILFLVVPAFKDIFSSFGAELPWLTQKVINLSEFGQSYGLLLIGVFFLLFYGIKRVFINQPKWQVHVHKILLRLPTIGQIIRNACIARWTRTLATLFASGVPLSEALNAIEGVTGNFSYQAATQSIHLEIMSGKSLSQALGSFDYLFSPMLIQMCLIGEESGSLDLMLHKTAEHYEQSVDTSIGQLSKLLEPFIMVILGILIGGLVMALYLPIFQLGQAV